MVITLVVAALIAGQDGPVLQGSGPLAGSSSGGGGGGGSVACPALPSVFLYQYDAADITATNGSLVSSWTSSGGLGSIAGLAPVDPTYKPIYETGVLNGRGVVSFDGVADALEVDASETNAAFFHSTQSYDFLIILRNDRVQYQAAVA